MADDHGLGGYDRARPDWAHGRGEYDPQPGPRGEDGHDARPDQRRPGDPRPRRRLVRGGASRLRHRVRLGFPGAAALARGGAADHPGDAARVAIRGHLRDLKGSTIRITPPSDTRGSDRRARPFVRRAFGESPGPAVFGYRRARPSAVPDVVSPPRSARRTPRAPARGADDRRSGRGRGTLGARSCLTRWVVEELGPHVPLHLAWLINRGPRPRSRVRSTSENVSSGAVNGLPRLRRA